MNTKPRTENNNKMGYWHILMLVALLLFLPLAQAIHQVGHDSLPSDIHCQICHSAIDLDGDNLPGSKVAFINNLGTVTEVTAKASHYQFNQSVQRPIRAPPINH
ncbi:MAG: hypothetical protein HRT35_16945 [Algicola sp.]|nr:hypothetical protein [Algicola sp.]